MALKSELMASSLPTAAASKLGFDTPATAVAAAGASQVTATPLTSNFSLVTTGSGGVIIQERHAITIVYNGLGGALNVYPPSGCSINAIAANSPFSLTSGKCAIIMCAGTNYSLYMSA